MILPPVAGEYPVFSAAEIGPMLVACGVALFIFSAAFGRAASVPVRDPFLKESLEYHN
ncbi:MAG: hypothetical protein GY842_25475 [bacterium]|nr:hypothetical protein [bacterium]